MLSPDQIVLANFIEHATRFPRATVGMKVLHSANCIFVDSGMPCDTFNIVFITNGDLITERELTHAVRYYQWKKYPFCIWINDEHLTERVTGIFTTLQLFRRNVTPEPGMIFEVEKYIPVIDERHAHLHLANSSEAVDQFAMVIASLFSPFDKNVVSYYRNVSESILKSDSRVDLVLYRSHGNAIGVAEMFASDNETLGIYGLVTNADARGRGIGSAIMTYALNRAKDLGYKRAVLQASEDGIGIYRRLGFVEVTKFYEYSFF